MKRLLTLALSVLMLFTSLSFVGCFGEDRSIQDIEGKVQLNVAFANLGYGTAFYEWCCAEFEKSYTKYDVQVKPNDRTSAQGNGDAGVSGLDDDLIFYGFIQQQEYLSSITDITDIYTVKAYDDNFNFVGRGAEGATYSLADRLDDNELQTLNYNETAQNMSERRFCGVPLPQGLYGFWYDVDLFEERGLYAKDAQTAKKLGYAGYDLIKGNADDCYGPDQVKGTTDDGLPATWEDFKTLMLYMKTKNISKRPFVWTGQHVWMQTRGTEQVMMSYEGANNYAIFSTFDGEYNLPDFNGDGVSDGTQTITPQTGYKLWDTNANGDFLYRQGEKAAVVFTDFIASNSLYAEGNVKGQSHTAAQMNFLDSRFVNDRNAFLLEGVHWLYEARAKFAEDAEKEGPEFGMDQRKFAFFPMPRFKGSEEIVDQPHNKSVVTLSGGGPAVTMLKGADRIDDDTNVNVLEVAKDFMLFLQSNDVLMQMAREWRNIPVTAVKATAAELAALNPMVANMLAVIEETKGENAVAETSRLYGRGLCRALGKTGEYWDAIQSSTKSCSIFGARLFNGGTANETIYLFNEFCVRHFNGSPISTQTWLAGTKKWVEEVKPADNWAKWIRGI